MVGNSHYSHVKKRGGQRPSFRRIVMSRKYKQPNFGKSNAESAVVNALPNPCKRRIDTRAE
jgi:hypothetical protein